MKKKVIDKGISDLKRFLGQQLVKYLTNKKLKAEDEELLRDIACSKV